MNNKSQVFASTEIVGALLTDRLTSEEAKAFAVDPHSMAIAWLAGDFSDISIAVVQNTDEQVHLALPYYEVLNGAEAQAVRDESLEEAQGGEIVIFAIGWLTACIVGAAGGGGTAMAIGGITASAVTIGLIVAAGVGGHFARKAVEESGK